VKCSKVKGKVDHAPPERRWGVVYCSEQ